MVFSPSLILQVVKGERHAPHPRGAGVPQPTQFRAKGSWVAGVCCRGGRQPANWRYEDAEVAGGRGDGGRA